ncbi:MAG: SPOR domain-containing protein [Pseudomonadota bacterium]
MARDYRHGHSHKKGFTRKSQQSSHQLEKRSVSLIWGAGFLVSAVLLIGFFVTQHFVSKGAKSAEPAEKTIFQSAVDLQATTTESVAEISEKLQPPQPKVPKKPIDTTLADSTIEDELSSEEEHSTQQYSFYQGLSQTEVIVDVEPISVKLDSPYYIQAGSFGSESMALKEQKRLARLGQIVQVSALHKPNRTYYRVRIGPFDNRLTLNKRRNELRRIGLGTLLIKASKPAHQP